MSSIERKSIPKGVIPSDISPSFEQLRLFESASRLINFAENEIKLISFLQRRCMAEDAQPFLTLDEHDLLLKDLQAFTAKALHQEAKKFVGSSQELQRRQEAIKNGIRRRYIKNYVIELVESMIASDSCHIWLSYLDKDHFEAILAQDKSPQDPALRVVEYAKSFLEAARQSHFLNRQDDGLRCQNIVEKFRASPLSPSCRLLVSVVAVHSRLKAEFWRNELAAMSSSSLHLPVGISRQLKDYNAARPAGCRRNFDITQGHWRFLFNPSLERS